MIRVGEDTNNPEAADKPKPQAEGTEHKPAAKQDEQAADESQDADSLPDIFHKMLPGIADILFPSESSSTPVPSPTMGAAAAASASGKLFHFDDEKSSGQGKQRRAVAPQPQEAPAAEVTEPARMNADADAVVYRTVTQTRTQTDCACASSEHGALAPATGATGASVVPAPVHGSDAVAATQHVESPETSAVAVPTGVDAAAATPVHGGLSSESMPSAHNVMTTTTSGSVFVHGASAPVTRSETRTVVASAFPTHSAFVAQVPSSSGAAMPTGVDPQTNSKDEGELFTGGAAWTGPREMVVMGVTGFLAVMMLL